MGEEIPVDNQEIDKDVLEAKAKIEEKLQDAEKKTKDALNTDDDEIKRKAEQVENIIVKWAKKFGSFVGYYSEVASEKAGSATYTITDELKNPVVVTQAVITATAIAGAVTAYQERFKFQRIPEQTLYIYAAVATGLVLLDGYAFSKYYGKYKK